jgi:hypothetical protein
MRASSENNRLLRTLSGYYTAVRKASGGNLLRLPLATMEVTHARIVFDIGPRFFSLFNFRAKPHTDWGTYLLDRDLKKELREANGEQRALTLDKARFTAHCFEHELATIPIIALIDTQPDLCPVGFPLASDAHELGKLLESAPARMFVKLIDGTLGIDAFHLAREKHGWSFCGRAGSTAELYSFLRERLGKRRGWMIQPLVEPHRSLKRIMAPGALGTVRAVTFRAEGEQRILLPILRIPAGDNIADNFSHGVSGNLVAPIDLASGVLGRARLSRDRSWPDIVVTDRHPDTGTELPGLVVPFWKETKHLLLKAQASTPKLRTIGWDIAITDTGPLIVEANSTYDIDLLQVAYDRGLRREFDVVLGRLNAAALEHSA